MLPSYANLIVISSFVAALLMNSMLSFSKFGFFIFVMPPKSNAEKAAGMLVIVVSVSWNDTSGVLSSNEYGSSTPDPGGSSVSTSVVVVAAVVSSFVVSDGAWLSHAVMPITKAPAITVAKILFILFFPLSKELFCSILIVNQRMI